METIWINFKFDKQKKINLFCLLIVKGV